MQIILFDDSSRYRLLPFTHTRPIADIRCGIFTMRERWEYYLKEKTGTFTEEYLQSLYPMTNGDNLYVNGSIFANQNLAEGIRNLPNGYKLVKDNTIIAFHTNNAVNYTELGTSLKELPDQHFDGDLFKLNHVWDIFTYNDRAIKEDFKALTTGKKSQPIPEDITVTGNDNLFIEEGANIYAGCIINASAGPVYIGKDAEVLEGTMIRGPLAMGEHAVIKMGAKIYGATTLGPGCKVGGEINNVVFFANSNKAHDGYLGNAVIGEWCNLGADTNCSNLKNNYDEVKIWDENQEKQIGTGLTFCGLMMGDHSKCGINTMFNTGTIIGVSCNIYGGDYPKSFIPSYCWGGGNKMYTYDFEKAMNTARRMMARRNKDLSPAEYEMLRFVFEKTKSRRDSFVR
jgi:UDP-N-acetylglucosamine diphosphorylase/glucosamine-1-phosphate N-acetyltransferase